MLTHAAAAIRRFTDGIIVGSSLKRGSKLAIPVDPKRVAALVKAMR